MIKLWVREDGTIIDLILDKCESCEKEISKECLTFCKNCYLLICDDCKIKKGCKSCQVNNK